MTRDDEYRANAAECQRMADSSRDPNDRATWLKMAASWLSMIEGADEAQADAFNAAAQTYGTGQPGSTAEH
jgi:hypothetical protein